MDSCAYIAPGSPPSSYAVAAVYEGDPAGWLWVGGGTFARSLFILPGLYLAGVRGKRLFLGSLLGSVTISTALFVFYGLRRSQAAQRLQAYTQAV